MNNTIYKGYFVGSGTVSGTSLNITSITTGSLWPTMWVNGGSLGTDTIQVISGPVDGGIGTYILSASGGSGAVSVTGITFGKNSFELKSFQRARIWNNFFQNAGGWGQPRSSITLTVVNQYGASPWNVVQDIDIQNNAFTNCQFGGINMLLESYSNGNEGVGGTQPCFRILFRNNLWIFTENDGTTGTAACFISSNTQSAGYDNGGGSGGDVVWDHNTFAGPLATIDSITGIGGAGVPCKLLRLVWSNNIWIPVDYPFQPVSPRTYANCIVGQVTNPAFVNNVAAGLQDSTIPTGFGNSYPTATSGIGFAGPSSGTVPTAWALASSSNYKGKGVSGAGQAYNSIGTADSTDVGCNVALLPLG